MSAPMMPMANSSALKIRTWSDGTGMG